MIATLLSALAIGRRAGSAAGVFAGSRIGQLAITAALAFAGGYSLKAKLDRTETFQAIVNKQRVDLQAARETTENTVATLTQLAEADAHNEGVINDLRTKLATRPPVVVAPGVAGSAPAPAPGPCTIDGGALDADAVRRLRQLR